MLDVGDGLEENTSNRVKFAVPISRNIVACLFWTANTSSSLLLI